ncbi:GGDEF domain-containing protein [Jeotgalibacillus salarius]|uniref:GGDEF domain-containing protein n=1 Tax=Jeotgalibacillus salarius TaxID=546023 RepID=A0A4Y8LBG6_9BACL|nr:GGDEF domain-containing protein [Jeotgalibacillus salarius]TFD99408.1 GGDEF domain-containing protein [Jeotgalibacillus salarius]
MKDIKTEQIFSYLRWIFLVGVIVTYWVPFLNERIGYEGESFYWLVSLFFLFTVIAQWQLQVNEKKQAFFPLLFRSGVWIDYGAYVWLIAITGGIQSDFLPIMYVILMHAMVHWKERGAIWMTSALIIGLWSSPYYSTGYTAEALVTGAVQTFVLVVMSTFSAVLVLRERRYFTQAASLGNELKLDDLTGLYNVRYFKEEMKMIYQQNKPFHLLIGDIDFFKVANDRYGHLFGDQVLAWIGPVLKRVAHEHNGTAFRYGGEEFVFLFPGKDFYVEDFLYELRNELERIEVKQEEWRLSLSFGHAVSEEGISVDDVIALADARLYQAKENGRACAVLNNDEVLPYLHAL